MKREGEYLSLEAVEPEEFKERVHAFLVMEELGREVTVEELNTISNGLVESWSRERGCEWFKVQLKHEVAISTAFNNKYNIIFMFN